MQQKVQQKVQQTVQQTVQQHQLPHATITIKHKAAQGGGIIKQMLPVQQRRETFTFLTDGIELHKLPTELLEGPLAILRTLPTDATPDFQAVVAARLILQDWLHQIMPQHCTGYIARNVTVRHSTATENMCQRKQLSVQLPVSIFHVDATHTPLINMWMPVGPNPITDYEFCFLEMNEHVLTTNGLIELFASKGSNRKTMLKQLSIVPLPPIEWGDIVVFRSGGPDAVVHGSYRFDDPLLRTGEDRLSVEFRCQQKQQQQPVNGTSASASNGWRYGKDEKQKTTTSTVENNSISLGKA